MVLLAVQNTTRTQLMVLQIDLCRHSVPITKAFCTRWRPLRFARVLHDRLSSMFEWTLELDNMTYVESNSSSLIFKSWITYLKDHPFSNLIIKSWKTYLKDHPFSNFSLQINKEKLMWGFQSINMWCLSRKMWNKSWIQNYRYNIFQVCICNISKKTFILAQNLRMNYAI